ncbi:hypothetical protein MC885_003357, partial [Smutsia gigantea]
MCFQAFMPVSPWNWLLLLMALKCTEASSGLNESTNSTAQPEPHVRFSASSSEPDEKIPVFALDYDYVQIPYEVTLWILLASLAKIGFHLYRRLPGCMPESCILITVGLLVGAIIFGTNHRSPPVMDSSIYFLYLLPPIVLEGGYFMPTRPFFENIGSILWWAGLGALINAFGIGLSLYLICQIQAFGLSDVNLLQNLLFGSLISAVDPVAVLAVFEEAHVNEPLYMMIFGEALLNDGISVAPRIGGQYYYTFVKHDRYTERLSLLNGVSGPGGDYKLSRSNEKEQLQGLNDRFAGYIEKVHYLEQQNKEIEVEIQALRQKQASHAQLGDAYDQEIRELRGTLEMVNHEKAQVQLDSDHLEEDIHRLKERFEEEARLRDDTEAAIRALRKDIEEASLVKVELDKKVQSLQDEVAFLRSNHEEEVANLLAQIQASHITVERKDYLKTDISSALKEIRSQLEQRLIVVCSGYQDSSGVILSKVFIFCRDVLYNILIAFTKMHKFEDIEPVDILAGCARFIVVGVGGVFFGIAFGFISAFITRFTQNISAIEPLIVFMFSYLSYLVAETLYLSGILAITACAVTMKKYVEENVSQTSYTTIKYFMKMLSSVSETLIFIFMGVFALFYVSNQFRTFPFSNKDQCIIFYSGVRGAGSFSLAFLLPLSLFPRKKMFVTATLVVIYFTVFIQGITIGPLVRYLDVKKTNKKESINEELHIRLMDHLKAGIEDVCGQWSHYQVRDKFKKFDHRYLRKILIRKNLPKSSIVSLYKKLEMKQAIEMVEMGILSSTTFTTPHLAQRTQGTKRLSPEDVESMRDILTHNMYQVRQRTLSYNKYNLKPQTSEKQAKEILIRRRNTLRESVRKGHSLPWGKP